MFDSDIGTMIDRYEMGQAYKTITEKMGPSAHLVAFIDYDKVTDESIGLESFNIMDRHHEILEEIEAIAVEGFLAKLLGRDIPMYKRFTFYKNYQALNMACHRAILTHIPKGFTLKEWNHFKDDIVDPEYAKFNREGMQMANEANMTGGAPDTSFKKSGWNSDNYASARAWLENEKKATDNLVKAHEAEINRIDEYKKNKPEGDKDHKEVIKVIDGSIADYKTIHGAAVFFLDGLEKILDRVEKKIEKE